MVVDYTHFIIYNEIMNKTHRLQVKISEADLKLLDKKRGSLSRSAYIRLLVDKAKSIKV